MITSDQINLLLDCLFSDEKIDKFSQREGFKDALIESVQFKDTLIDALVRLQRNEVTLDEALVCLFMMGCDVGACIENPALLPAPAKKEGKE